MNSFWNRAAAGAAALLFLFSFRVAAYAGPTVIKMATLAPEGSSWHRVRLERGEECDYVRARPPPLVEQRLEEKGFVVLNWGDAGWVHFFAREAFTHPSEMKAMKLYIGAGDVPLTQLYKEAGFKPVPISVVDILPGLQTGLLAELNATPLAALGLQWFAL